MGKRIFITGIAGFIGFHAALKAVHRGDFVIGCDHFNDYYDPLLKRERAALLKEKGIETLDLDICHTEEIKKLLKKHSITTLLHLAAQAGVRHALDHAEQYVHSNLTGFVSLLEALKETPEVAFVYASSSSVYGNRTKAPFVESDSTDAPASFYGATKKCNEVIASSYHSLFGIRCTGLRFFTVYGPFGRPDMAYFSFTKAILEGKPVPVFGEGTPKRDFTYIDDIVIGILAAIDLEAPCEIFNLGNHTPVSVMEMITLLEKHLQKKAELVFHPLPPGDVLLTYADISKSQKQLGFHPKVSFEEGLSRFVNWYLKK